MGTVIAINGKGGTGKSTIAALMVERISRHGKHSVLAIDADPNSTLPELLGIANPPTIVAIVEEISRNLAAIPHGMTKDRYIAMRIQEAIVETDRFDLLAMGRPEGPGCYCYVNNLLRELLGQIVAQYDVVVVDNAAGMEHISRRTMRAIDALVLVSDYSVNGIRSTKRIYDLARELSITVGKPFLVVNKAAGPLTMLQEEIDKTALPLLGVLPYSDAIHSAGLRHAPASQCDDPAIGDLIADMISRMMKG